MIAELIESNEIKKVCIVDDANEEIPTKEDLSHFSDEWNVFLDDVEIHKSLVDIIKKHHPNFLDSSFNTLESIDDDLIETLWSIRNDFPEVLSQLFEAYESTKTADISHVETLKNTLEECGLDVQLVGRDFSDAVTQSDILFIDLFLYQNQTSDNLDYTSQILRDKILNTRQDNPPIVVLISRSERLDDLRESFREKCGLIESSFRIYKKSDLEDKHKLLFCLKKLISHYQDSIRVWRFLNSWEHLANKAVVKTVDSLKKIDLLDHCMVHKLLLNEEGQSTASYFLDLFDSVLLHNFESESELITKAKELNKIGFENPPSLHGLEKEPLQELMYKSSFHGEERWELTSPDTIELGDVFKVIPSPSGKFENDYLVNQAKEDDVWVVITPACDLARDGIENISFLKGKIKKININNWNSKCNQTTPILKINEVAYSIQWNFKSFMTHPLIQVKELISTQTFSRVAKMRDVCVLGIQQKFTADFGRVGQRAAMPAVFNAEVKLAYIDTQGELIELNSPKIDNAICYAGPEEEKIVNFSLSGFDTIIQHIIDLKLENIAPHAKKNITDLKESPYDLIEILEYGINANKKITDIKTSGIPNPVAKLINCSFDALTPKEKKGMKSVGIVFSVNITSS